MATQVPGARCTSSEIDNLDHTYLKLCKDQEKDTGTLTRYPELSTTKFNIVNSAIVIRTETRQRTH